jgi:fermentation-respiration switch protein FrsA (DUF1100 family)
VRELPLSVPGEPPLAGTPVPVLAVTGEKDLQVPAEDLDAIAAGTPGQVEVHRVPDLTHTLRRQPGRASRPIARSCGSRSTPRCATPWSPGAGA